MVCKNLTLIVCCVAACGDFRHGMAQPLAPRVRVTGPGTRAHILDRDHTLPPVTAHAVPSAAPAERRSIPPIDELEAARSLVREACDELYRDNPGRPRFVVEQLWTYADQTSDSARCYALLQEAERIATGSADVDLVVANAVRRARTFDVDAYATLIESLRQLPVERGTIPELFGFFMAISRDALADEEFAASREAQHQALKAAQKLARVEKEEAHKLRKRAGGLARPPAAKGTGLIDEADSHLTMIESRHKAFELYQSGRDVIGRSPDDGEANWNVGFYMCHFRSDWEHGLPFLAKGNRKGVRDISHQELSAGQGTLPGANMKIADSWWKLEADAALTREERQLAKSRAKMLYREVMPHLVDPLDRSLVERRLADAE